MKQLRIWCLPIFFILTTVAFYAQATLLPPVTFEKTEKDSENSDETEKQIEKPKNQVPSSFSISEFGIKTEGKWNDTASTIILSSSASLAIDFKTGKDVCAEVGFSLDAYDIEKLLNDPTVVDSGTLALQFNRASISLQNINGSSWFFRFFVGKDGKLGSGTVFQREFETQAIRPIFEKTSSNDDLYNGIHQVIGTGVQIGTKAKTKPISTSLFIYQDSVNASNVGVYAADLTCSVDFPTVKMSAFAGYSYPKATLGVFRTGAMLYLTNNKGSALYSEFGIPYFQVAKQFTIEDMYILFEPQTQLGTTNLSLTFFYNPKYYLEKEVDEAGNIDISGRISFGKPNQTSFLGGFEATVTLKPKESSERYDVLLSPFCKIKTEQASWAAKVNVDPLKFTDPKKMLSFNISIKADF